MIEVQVLYEDCTVLLVLRVAWCVVGVGGWVVGWCGTDVDDHINTSTTLCRVLNL